MATRGCEPFGLPSNEFISLYRLDKRCASGLINTLRPFIDSNEISPENKVLATLKFMATGDYHRGTGIDFHVDMSETIMSRCIVEVVSAITAHMSQDYIQFPTTEEDQADVKAGFYKIAGLPCVLSAIDGFHVPIVEPIEDAHAYVNRRGYHSVCVMIASDASLEIRAINARFPGDSTDSFVWYTSSLRHYLKSQNARHALRGYLVGDQEYPLEPWLHTPILDAQAGTLEARYTEDHMKTRGVVDKCIRLLKTRFRCLTKTLYFSPDNVGRIISAAAVLHNICIRHKIPKPDDVTDLDVYDNDADDDQYEDDIYENEFDEEDDDGSATSKSGLRRRGIEFRNAIIYSRSHICNE